MVKGVGAIAGGPYYCAHGSVWTALYNCMTPAAWTPLPQTALLKSQADSQARAGRIDPTENLAGARVWLFSGKNDRTVLAEVVFGLGKFFEAYGVKSPHLVVVSDQPAGHAMVTESAGNACAVTASPYINDCDYDGAGELLKHLHGVMKAPAENSNGRPGPAITPRSARRSARSRRCSTASLRRRKPRFSSGSGLAQCRVCPLPRDRPSGALR